MRYIKQTVITPIDLLFNDFITCYGKYTIINKKYDDDYYLWKHSNIDINTIKKFVKKRYKNTMKWQEHHIDDGDVYLLINNINKVLIRLEHNPKSDDKLYLIKDY